MADTLTPRIYVASLTDYNSGELHGKWIDADQSADEIMAEVQEMLAASPAAAQYGEIAEEWAIHDYDEFGGIVIGEWDSFERIELIAEAITKWPPLVVKHFLDNDYSLAEIHETIGDLYMGDYDGSDEVSAVANMLWEGLDEREDIPEDIRPHIGAIARSMAVDEIQGGGYTTVYAGDGAHHILSADS
ncbi:antirestriction protein ArdA [Kitasatospora sp. NPDC004723]|uniref:antirestriction protein ArdA n=1 Tax=Kitasatospora sp. NPDC004723 TaxID=3154288 RepID=UPI00339F807F